MTWWAGQNKDFSHHKVTWMDKTKSSHDMDGGLDKQRFFSSQSNMDGGLDKTKIFSSQSDMDGGLDITKIFLITK